jgi:hypothetical protein
MRGLAPYGFIGKYQGLNAEGKTVAQVAEFIFRILVNAPATRNRMLTCLTDQVIAAPTEADALAALQLLGSIPSLAAAHVERLKAGAQGAALFESLPLQVELNRFLLQHGVGAIGGVPEAATLDHDETPFWARLSNPRINADSAPRGVDSEAMHHRRAAGTRERWMHQ